MASEAHVTVLALWSTRTTVAAVSLRSTQFVCGVLRQRRAELPSGYAVAVAGVRVGPVRGVSLLDQWSGLAVRELTAWSAECFWSWWAGRRREGRHASTGDTWR